MARLTWDNEGERLYETGIKEVVLYVWDDDIVTAGTAADPQPTSETFAAGTYYTRTGTGTTADPYVYTKAESFASTDTPTYYVATAKGAYANGVAWNGITAVNETPTGAEATDLYADDQKYLSLLSAEELEGTVEAYTYPDEWEQCDGSASPVDGIVFGQQARKQFCLAYITTVGNDTNGNDYGEKLHILYNCKASPSERAYATINDSPEAITFSWSLKATKASIDQETYGSHKLKNTALITVDSKKTASTTYEAIKDAIQGSQSGTAHVLMPNDVLALLSNG